jgi:hypothetical protein
MSPRIHRHPQHNCSVIEMDQAHRDQIRRLGVKVQRHLIDQVTVFWAKPGGPELLAKLLAGALILRSFGVKTEADRVLKDSHARLGLLACITVALAPDFEPGEHACLQETITLLAMCSPVLISIPQLPPFGSLPPRYREHDHILQLYRMFALESKEPPEVTQYSALLMLRLFQRAGRPEDAAVVLQLLKITAGLRTALQRLREAPSTKSE